MPVALMRRPTPGRQRSAQDDSKESGARAIAAVIAALLAGACLAPAAASEARKPGGSSGTGGPARPAPRPPAAEELTRLAAEVVRTTRQYRASLDNLRAIYERDVAEGEQRVEEGRAALGIDPGARARLEEAEFGLATARQSLDEVLTWIHEADQLLLEAAVVEQVSQLPRLRAGAYADSGTLVRYNGPARFGLDALPRIERYFLTAVGQALPVSARGQTALHNRMGLDHRDAVDVAVHPDSPEGRALTNYLRGQGIPFIGVRGAWPGASTGAHIHIGQPSPRLLGRQ
jgi:hypothetical protein